MLAKDTTDDQIIQRVAELFEKKNARRPCAGITAYDVAPNMPGIDGPTVQQVAPRLARLVREGRLSGEYDPKAGHQGAMVYRPA